MTVGREQHRIPHDLPHGLARAATRAALDSYRRRFAHLGPTGRWVDDDTVALRFQVAGRPVDAEVRVDADAIVISMDVPRLFRPLRQRAIAVIDQEVRRWVERARRGEFDPRDED